MSSGAYEASRAHVDVLRDVPLFAGLDDEALRGLAQASTEVELPAGHVLCEPGHHGCGLFVVLDGSAEVRLGDQTVERGPGEILGELSLLVDDLTHVARVQAATRLRCLAIGRGAFARLLDEHPQVAVALLPVLARRLAETQTLV